MALRNRAHQRQPQAHTTVTLAGAGQAVERLKNTFTLGGWHTGAMVADPHQRVARFAVHLQFHLTLAVAAGVLQQVAHGAAQQAGHAGHLHCVLRVAGVQQGVHPGALLGGEAGQVDGLDRADVGLLRVQSAGQQDLVNELVEFGDVAVQLGAHRRIGRCHTGCRLHQLQAHADTRQRRAQLV